MNSDSESGAAALVREPQQARSRRTLGRLLDASLDILDREGPDGLTVTRIAKRAKSSVGSFYARFDGKEGLVRYLGERSLEEAFEAWSDVTGELDRTAPLATSGEVVVRGLAGVMLEGPGRPLVLLDGLEESDRPRVRRLEDEVASGLRGLAGNDARARVAAMTVISVLAQIARDGTESERERLLRELVRLVVGYLDTEPAGATETHSAAKGLPDVQPAGDGSREDVTGPVSGPDRRSTPSERSPWDVAAEALMPAGSGRVKEVAASEVAATDSEAAHEGEDKPDDEIEEIELAFRDLAAELEDSEPERESEGEAPTATEDGPEDEEPEDDIPMADPFDVWG